VGYQINFNRYFYRYTPPRRLEDIEADIPGIERDILRMLADSDRHPEGDLRDDDLRKVVAAISTHRGPRGFAPRRSYTTSR
jgi:hypothetical protein